MGKTFVEKIPLAPRKDTLIRCPVCCCSSTPGVLIRARIGEIEPPDLDTCAAERTETAAGASCNFSAFLEADTMISSKRFPKLRRKVCASNEL